MAMTRRDATPNGTREVTRAAMRDAMRDPSFLPLTLSAADAVDAMPVGLPTDARADAETVRDRAREVHTAAAECWASLLAGCDLPTRWTLPGLMRALSDSIGAYGGTQWWFGAGSGLRNRIARAQLQLSEAIADRDGADFAEAFAGYDQAVATALVRAQHRIGSIAP